MDVFQIAGILTTLTAFFAYLNYRFLKLPVTTGLMLQSLLLSLLLALLMTAGVDVVTPARRLILDISFDVFFLQGMLSFLLFAGALFVKVEELLTVKVSVAVFAVAGVLISTVIIGGAFSLLSQLLDLNMRPIYCLLFGALISPTDPVAVLPTLRRLGIPDRLNAQIAGEALFNDGVGIVLFLSLLAAAQSGHPLGISGVAAIFLRQTAGGILFGTLLGWAGYFLIKTVDNFRLEILITLALVTGGYALARSVEVSGPLAMVVAGLLIGGRGRKLAMSEHTRENLDHFWELVEEFLNAILFTVIGLQLLVLSDRLNAFHLVTGVAAIPIVLLGRFLSVLVLGGLLRLREHFSLRDVSVMTWSGLRGGIPIALAMSLPDVRELSVLLVATYLVVVFSILVQGSTLKRLIET
ncbi:sodium:proton antiporter [Geomonas sp.]|uniref:cation:proton antiporter n=1 Tax=Geomonas sp. TaxID=2651584 RepID=UPI002B4715CE|nr:sodium:proton antiporter [Geomonas sp.]HJV35278.1 sodium:proton antiporter [Geomonas sp.]